MKLSVDVFSQVCDLQPGIFRNYGMNNSIPFKSGVYNSRVWRLVESTVGIATVQRTRPRAVDGVPRRAAWLLKSALRNSVSAAYNNFLHFFCNYWW